MDEQYHHQWRARLKKRRGKAFKSVAMRELNLVAMMDMMTIILVFLLKSYSGSSLSMDSGSSLRFPQSSETMVPQEAIKLTVTRFEPTAPGTISVGDQNVIKLDQSKMTQLSNLSKSRQFMIQEIFQALQAEIARVRGKTPQTTTAGATVDPKTTIPFDGKILIIADKETPYWLITQVLFTSAQAGFEKYNLVAIQEKQ